MAGRIQPTFESSEADGHCRNHCTFRPRRQIQDVEHRAGEDCDYANVVLRDAPSYQSPRRRRVEGETFVGALGAVGSARFATGLWSDRPCGIGRWSDRNNASRWRQAQAVAALVDDLQAVCVVEDQHTQGRVLVDDASRQRPRFWRALGWPLNALGGHASGNPPSTCRCDSRRRSRRRPGCRPPGPARLSAVAHSSRRSGTAPSSGAAMSLPCWSQRQAS